MKKSKLLLLAMMSFVLLTSEKCNPSKKDPAVNESVFSGDCPLERLDWMTVKTGYDSETLSELAASLKVAAQADLSKINQVVDGNASVDGGFNSSLQQLIQGKAEKSSIVSQDFWETYNNLRSSTCNLFQAVNKGFYGDDEEALKEARKTFNKIQAKFAEIEETEKKKVTIDVAKFIELGNKSFKEEDWVDAKYYYDEVLEVDPKNPRLLEKRGYCNFKLNKTAKAIDDFSKAIQLTEDEYQLFFFRGNAYLQANDFTNALADLNFFLDKRPDHSSAINQRGLVKTRQENLEDACEDFRRSKELGNEIAQINIDKYCK